MSDRRSVTCHHEAAHACVALALNLPVFSLQVFPDGSGSFNAAAPVQGRSEEERRDNFDALCAASTTGNIPVDLNWLRCKLATTYAGSMANSRLTGGIDPSCDIDYADACSLLTMLPEAQRTTFSDDAIRLASTLVDRNWPVIERIARKLDRFGELNEPMIRVLAHDVTASEPAAPSSHVHAVINRDGGQVGEVLHLLGLHKFAAVPRDIGVIGYFDDRSEAQAAVLASRPVASGRR